MQASAAAPTDSAGDLVLDTNVVLDWLVFGHPIGAVLAVAFAARRFRWLCTRAMRDELAHVMARDALRRWSIDATAVLAAFDAAAIDVGTPAAPSASAPLRCSDASDQKFLDLALALGAHALLTRDRALLRLASRARRRDLRITTPEAWAGSLRR
ncbi:MAG: PIN domain-containing protein [Rhizobacter sp.]|nr:PIN domain-containing protein [Rhizobacter sp.]